MFAVIYRWKVKPGTEEQFQDAWRRGTKDLVRLFNSGGSRLHRASDGSWVAYAQWPTKEARDDAFRDGPPNAAVAELQSYVLEEIEQISLEITEDLLVAEGQLG
ncbi:MAG: hypothetical protein ACI8Z1_002333 [Candidatus Azotimanducaceae bacterium]